MATAPEARAPQPGIMSGIEHLALEHIKSLLHPEEGFLVSEASSEQGLQRNPVVSRESIGKADRSRLSKTEREIYTLENGRHYEVDITTPKHQRSDISIVLDTALTTTLDGHNENTIKKLSEELGFVVIGIGAEGGHSRWPNTFQGWLQFWRNFVSINLAETAANHHEILEEADQLGIYTPGKTAKTGESRGAATAYSFEVISHEFNREIVYSDNIAPCFPEPKPITANPIKAGQRLLEAGGQGLSLAKNALVNTLHGDRHYLGTVKADPYFWLHIAATVPTLVNGHAGKGAREVDPNAKMYNAHFEDDPWDVPEEWKKIFKNHLFVVDETFPGDHGGILHPEIQEARLTRFRGFRDELEANGQNVALIDWDNVHMGGRLAVAMAEAA